VTRFVFAVGVWLAVCLPIAACAVSAQQHAANTAEAAQATAEYDACRQQAKDGGTFATFCECVKVVDAKHRIDGGPCE
jgi:hypothetical protein